MSSWHGGVNPSHAINTTREPCNKLRAQLEKVAGQDELQAAKGLVIAPQLPASLLQALKKLRRHHADLINDEHLRQLPMMITFTLAGVSDQNILLKTSRLGAHRRMAGIPKREKTAKQRPASAREGNIIAERKQMC